MTGIKLSYYNNSNTYYNKTSSNFASSRPQKVSFTSNSDSFIKDGNQDMNKQTILNLEIQKMLKSDNEKMVLDYLYNLTEYTKLILGTCTASDVKKSLQLLINSIPEEQNKKIQTKMLEIIRNAVYPDSVITKELDFTALSKTSINDEYCQNLINTITKVN